MSLALFHALAEALPYATCLLAAAVLWLAANPVDRFRYRHIPGPFAWPFLGNLIPILTKGQHVYFTELRAKFGPIFKVRYCGEPWVVISDPDAVRRIAHRLPNRWTPPHTLLGLEKQVLHDTLVLQPGHTWRLLKKAWDPAMSHRSSLEGYAPVMQECIDVAVERLQHLAEQGSEVDMYVEFQNLTMEVVGVCAFGIKFQGGGADDGSDGWGSEGADLLKSFKAFFKSQELDSASRWVLPLLMFPSAATWFRCLAYLLPDAGHRSLVQSMRHMVASGHKIIQASRRQRQANATKGVTDGGILSAPAPGGKGVLPGSFVVQMEAWKAKHQDAEGVTDDLVAAQVITFLLGGYEATTASLTFCIHDLAAHPEAQQKLQQELDTLLGGRTATLDDLPKLVYLDACLKESLRLGGATPYIGRKYDTDGQASIPNLSILGYSIPSGTNVCMYTYSLQRDPQHWARPQEFLPERFLPESGGKLGPFTEHVYLPFGAGRKCVGYKFAEQELALAACALLQRFCFSLPIGAGPLRKKVGLTFAPVGGLKVHVQRRKPASS